MKEVLHRAYREVNDDAAGSDMICIDSYLSCTCLNSEFCCLLFIHQ